MRRVLTVLGLVLLVLPPLAGWVVGMIPFDFQVTTGSPLVTSLLSPAPWMLLGGVLLLLGLRWRRG
ncbi:hypothetical protein L1280_001350 [Deinococcus sp. HSC-46F16]|nr:hypothetical protein [Deinococcus sp. HSC-46F16]